MHHVDDSKWITTKTRFSFAGLFSGAISLLISVSISIALFFNGRTDVSGNFLKVFALIELLIVVAIGFSILVVSLLRSFGSTRTTFKKTFIELYLSVEQVWFYIPLTLALVVYLVFGGI